MRRFVDTFAGKALCHLAAMALVLPTVTLTMAGRAEAQVTQLPSWAVTEFKDLKGNASLKYGQAAADAVAGELAKTNRYDVVAQDTIKRSIETLGLSSPLEGLINLSRVGQDVRANTIVAGEILDYRVKSVGGGKQALVAVRMVAYDVVSGLPVNGALEKGESTIRGGNVTNETLVNDAIGQAAAVAVRTMQQQQLPSATVLNTGTKTALINQGTRSGFKTGDTVIITRGNLQVGTGRIGVIEPDQAEMTVERIQLGLAPGDRVRAVFSPAPLPAAGREIFNDRDGINVSSRPRRSSNNATLISALLVVGLVAVLLGSGNSSGTGATASVTAQPTLDNGVPAVYINWSPNGFFKGSGSSGNGVSRWQIYRDDVSGANPVLVIGARTSVVDSSRVNNSDFPTEVFQPTLNGGPGGTVCNYTTPATGTRTTTPLLTAGTPYRYQVEAVYKVSSLDLPDGSTGQTSGTTSGTTSGSTSGTTTSGTTTSGTTTSGTTTSGTTTSGTTTSGTTTSGTTTSGSTSGTTSTGAQSCYFVSGRSSSGTATPLNRPAIGTPNNQQIDTSNQTFVFASAQNAGTTNSSTQITQQFVLEFSDDPSFIGKYTVAVFSDPATTRITGTSVTFPINVASEAFNKKGRLGGNLRTASPLFYRIGVRNASDRPGPIKDTTSGRRFIYSLVGQFTRPVNPPSQPIPTGS